MNLHGLTLVRNDDWCLPFTMRVSLQWVDQLHVLVHASGPSTQQIVQDLITEYPGRVTLFVDPTPIWDEMNQRQTLLDIARQCGATHMAMIDADEFLTGNLLPGIRDLVAKTPSGTCLSIPKVDCWGAVNLWRDERPFDAPLSLAFQDKPEYSWKPRQHGYQHHCRPPQPLTAGHCPQVEGGIVHLQFSRPNAVRAKQAHYKMIEVLRWPQFGVGHIDKKYSWWDTTPKLSLVPPAWIEEPYQDILPLLDLADDKPDWHRKEIWRLMEEHGAEKFAGLNLWGMEKRV